ncbi:hypothetical protein EMCRGX_G021851 [Ephydatia muelleri]
MSDLTNGGGGVESPHLSVHAVVHAEHGGGKHEHQSDHGVKHIKIEKYDYDGNKIDEKRKEHIAYEYLCHLEEAKKWIEACITDELPPTTELEQALRNGVILCKLGHFYAPDIMPLKKIYDMDESKYRAKGLHFKHTDNFNFWLETLKFVGLPKIFYPITTDLYDRKNMPRVIYCIHALSLYLHKLGQAPLIEDLLGTATFTEEEISAMKTELDKYGIQMPHFGKIGGILANEMPVDEVALHAAVMAINDVLDKGGPQELMVALKNAAAHLIKLDSVNTARYYEALRDAKARKTVRKADQNPGAGDEERDVYDVMLTQADIQDIINEVNTTVKKEIAAAKLREGLSSINQEIQSGSVESLLKALCSEDVHLTGVIPENIQWYKDILLKSTKDKAESMVGGSLTREEIQDILTIANEVAEHTRAVVQAVLCVNKALDQVAGTGSDAEAALHALLNENLDLADVVPANKQYYYEELLRAKKAKETLQEAGVLTEEEIQQIVNRMNEKAEYDRNVAMAVEKISTSAVQGSNPEEVLSALHSSFVGVGPVDDSCATLYAAALQKAVEEKGRSLSQDEIKVVVEQVNERVRLQNLLQAAIMDVNAAVRQEASDVADVAGVLRALRSQYARFESVQDSNAPHYVTLLKAARAAKAEKCGDLNVQLTEQEIQAVINKANVQTQEAIELARAVASINSKVDSGDASVTLEALKASVANIRSISDECADAYCKKLAEAKAKKIQDGVLESGGWTEHRTRDGYVFYYNVVTGESQWEKPEGFSGQSRELTKDEIQAVVTKTTADYDRWTLLKANEPTIVQMQSFWRGIMVRKEYRKKRQFLKEHEKEIVKIQAVWKGHKAHKSYKQRLEYLGQKKDQAVLIQSVFKMHRARKAYKDRQQFFKSHVADIVKIQSFWRAKKAKQDYKQLVEVIQPPTSAVRKFLSLLEQSDIDFSEELECQRLKALVVQQIRANQQLEQDLYTMDIKIGLLVKNTISLEDVVSHSRQVNRNRARGTGADGQELVPSTGGFSKQTQAKIEGYQHLFYLLQTKPHYFARLIFEMPQSKTNRFMENVILTVFNYAHNNREQYLLLKMFETALNEEVKNKVDKLADIITGNPTVIKMVVHFTRGVRGQNTLRDLLGPLIQEVLATKDVVLLTSAVDVYKAWINHMETMTGEPSKLPYDVSNDQALEYEEVRTRIASTVTALTDFSNRFLVSIMESLNKIPYGMKFIAMKLRLALHEKFPEAPEDDIIKVVGNLLYYRYMNPAIVAPDAFDIVDVGMDNQLTPDQRRNLGAIAKVLQAAAACKMFEGENAALSCMNPYIQEAWGKFRDFFSKASTVETAEERFGIDEYSDVIMLTKPVIYISVKEVVSTHSLLLEHEDAISPKTDDPLRIILKELGTCPTVESLLGGVRDAAPGEDPQDIVNEAGKQEIPLTLTNRFEGVAGDDGSSMKTLFVRTKRMVVDVLRVQPGENLTSVLYTPATPEQEEEHQTFIRKREQLEQDKVQRSTTIRRSESMSGDRNLPLEGMKRKIMRNLRTLEQENMVNSKDDYQEIVNAIAKDIRNQHRYRQQRKQELTRLQETLEKLKQKAKFCEEQMECYNVYVKSCLDRLGKVGSKGRTEFKRQTVKYTAQKLYEKKVIRDIEGLPQHQFRSATFEITSTDIGKFEISGKFLGIEVQRVELVFQDLLQLQYEGLAIMKMFGRVTVNVNLLIHLINQKFYGRES